MSGQQEQPFDTRVALIHELMGDGSESLSWHGTIGHVHLVTDPEEVREAYHREHFGRSDFMAQVGGDGLIFSDGLKWREHRRLAQPFFHERVMDRYTLAMDEAVGGLIDRLGSFADAGTSFDLTGEAIRFTVRTLYSAIFGVELAPDHDTGKLMTRYFDAVGEVTLAILAPGNPIPSEALTRLGEIRREINQEIDRILETRVATAVPEDDLIGTFNSQIEQDELKDEILTFFLAGAETTSNLLTWLLVLLEADRAELERVEEELDSVLGGREIGMSDLGKLPRLQSVIYETMRLYPPVWLTSRQATCDTTLSGRAISAMDWVLVCIYLVHRNPRIWDDPHLFRPERFRDQMDGPDRYAFIPFGGGRHLCIGKHFAELESMLVTARILRSFRLERVDNKPLSPWPGLTLKPAGDVQMRVRRR